MKCIRIMILLAYLALVQGCTSTTPGNVAYKTEGVIIPTVDASMKAWSDYVRGGMATQQQVDLVKAAYGKYYAAQQVAHAGVALAVSSATTNSASVNLAAMTAAVDDAKNGLVTLVADFIGGKK